MRLSLGQLGCDVLVGSMPGRLRNALRERKISLDRAVAVVEGLRIVVREICDGVLPSPGFDEGACGVIKERLDAARRELAREEEAA